MSGSSVGEQFVFRGDLASDSLPELLATIHRHGVPGVLECTRDDSNKCVFFATGDIIFATSSDRDESLGESLLRDGLITEDQLRLSSDELRRNPGRRHGTVLVQMGFLEPHELGSAVRKQVQAIVWSLFSWTDGSVTFRVGNFKSDEVYKIKIPTARAIFEGCRRLPDPKLTTARLGGRNGVLQPVRRPPHLDGLELDDDERELIELVDGSRTLYELCEAGPLNPGINARILYAALVLRLVGPDPSTDRRRIQSGNR
jgi:hypothetical protein